MVPLIPLTAHPSGTRTVIGTTSNDTVARGPCSSACVVGDAGNAGNVAGVVGGGTTTGAAGPDPKGTDVSTLMMAPPTPPRTLRLQVPVTLPPHHRDPDGGP